MIAFVPGFAIGLAFVTAAARAARAGWPAVVAVGGDGQVTLGNTIMKGDAQKVRRLLDGQVPAQSLGEVQLKGLQQKITAYRVSVPD